MNPKDNKPGSSPSETLAVSAHPAGIAVQSPQTVSTRAPVETPAASTLMQAYTAVVALQSVLDPHLELLPPGVVPKITVDPVLARAAMHRMATLLHEHPKLAVLTDPVAMEVDLATVAAAEALEQALSDLLREVQDTRRVALDRCWQCTLQGYHVTNRAARKDKTLALKIAPIRAVFVKPSHAEAAPRNAADLLRRAGDAALRAVKARHKADVALQKAAATGHVGYPLPPPESLPPEPPKEPGTR